MWCARHCGNDNPGGQIPVSSVEKCSSNPARATSHSGQSRRHEKIDIFAAAVRLGAIGEPASSSAGIPQQAHQNHRSRSRPVRGRTRSRGSSRPSFRKNSASRYWSKSVRVRAASSERKQFSRRPRMATPSCSRRKSRWVASCTVRGGGWRRGCHLNGTPPRGVRSATRLVGCPGGSGAFSHGRAKPDFIEPLSSGYSRLCGSKAWSTIRMRARPTPWASKCGDCRRVTSRRTGSIVSPHRPCARTFAALRHGMCASSMCFRMRYHRGGVRCKLVDHILPKPANSRLGTKSEKVMRF